jgi:predicted nucleotidyltransferase
MVEADELPEAVSTGIDAFTAAARKVFADTLVSIVLFGSAAEGRLRATSDVNLIVVLSRADPAALDAIGPAYRLGRAAIRLSVMFILDTEIALASEAFAVKFADVSARHRLLYGSDPFEGLVVDRDAAIRRLRQVLINLTLRLREHVALSGAFPEQLALAAADAVGPLRACAALILSLESGTVLHPREALVAIATDPGPATALAAITRAREIGGVPEAGATATILAAIGLAGLLETRAESLG